MGSPSAVLSVGFGSWGSVGEVVTLGFGSGAGNVLIGSWFLPIHTHGNADRIETHGNQDRIATHGNQERV